MANFSDEHANELRDLFFESSQEILQALNEDALLLEKSPHDAGIVRNLRRSVHTLKGDSAACGFTALSDLAHAVEDVLTPEIAARDGEALTELVLVAADSFDNLLSAYRNQLAPPSTQPAHQLIEALRNPKPAEPAFAPQFNWTEYERLVISKAAVAGQQVYNIGLAIDPNCPFRAGAVQLVRNVLQEAGTVLVMRPDESVGEPETIEAAISSPHPLDWVQRKAKIPTVVSKIHAEPLASGEPAPAPAQAAETAVTESGVAPLATPAPEQAPPTTAAEPAAPLPAEGIAPLTADAAQTGAAESEIHRPASTENVIRVEASRIDVVLDLVGELIIAKSMMQELLADMHQNLGRHNSLRARSTDILQLQGQILNKLQRSVMKIRMVPVERLFRRLPRIVRDTAKQLGREVKLEMQGESTDLDKSILDALGEPMMHIVRNSVDHGIEPPAERLAAGKPAEGTIRLNAYHQGNQVVIEIADDGRGIDLQKVLKKAMDRGLVTSEQAGRLSEKEITDFIFHAGLSTASRVTQVSGRGVGMDIVRAVLDRLKGSVSVRTVPGEGTTFKLIMPLTLAIIKALLFRVCGRLYAVPLGNVLEIVRAWDKDLHVIDGQEVLRIREEVVPLIQLSRMHGTSDRPAKWFVIVVTLGDRKAGLVVDHLIGEQELVIKALDECLVSSELVSGASILGDGRVVPILSIANVVEKLGRGFARNSVESAGMGVR